MDNKDKEIRVSSDIEIKDAYQTTKDEIVSSFEDKNIFFDAIQSNIEPNDSLKEAAKKYLGDLNHSNKSTISD